MVKFTKLWVYIYDRMEMPNSFVVFFLFIFVAVNLAISQSSEDAIRIFNNQVGFGTRRGVVGEEVDV